MTFYIHELIRDGKIDVVAGERALSGRFLHLHDDNGWGREMRALLKAASVNGVERTIVLFRIQVHALILFIEIDGPFLSIGTGIE